MRDRFGREIRVLRVSVTDRCDLRCTYCAPVAAGQAGCIARRDLLSAEEIALVARAATSLGIDRVRLTGGEPLVRDDVVEIAARLARTPGLSRLSLTTNGQRLARLAGALAAAGLDAVNVSVDSLDPVRFAEIRRGGSLRAALDGIDAALAAGLEVKVNAVIVRGVNDDEVVALARLALDRPLHVRFLEYMPAGDWAAGGDAAARLVPGDEVLARLRAAFGALERRGPAEDGGPAIYHAIPGARGSVGVITAVSRPFCDRCNRLRLLAGGRLRPCLFGEEEIELRPALDEGLAAVREALVRAIEAKPEGGRRARLFPLRMTGG